jgi:hypothetical protein
MMPARVVYKNFHQATGCICWGIKGSLPMVGPKMRLHNISRTAHRFPGLLLHAGFRDPRPEYKTHYLRRFLSQLPGQVFFCRFGDIIRADPREIAHRGMGTEKNGQTTALLKESWHRGPDKLVGRRHMRFQDLLKVVGWQLPEKRARMQNPGSMNEAIEIPHFQGLHHHGRRYLGSGSIPLNLAHFYAQLFTLGRSLRQDRLVPGVQHQVHSKPGQLQGQGPADAQGGPGMMRVFPCIRSLPSSS